MRAHFNTDDTTFGRVVQEHGIKPRYNINGRDFYDLSDFGDAATLLRPAAPPENPQEVLLRPASHTEALPEQLLRAANTNDE